MPARLLAVALLLPLLAASLLTAQEPLLPQPADPVGKALITEPPIKPGDTPAAMPETSAESVTAAETAVLAAHDATIAATEALDFDRLFSFLVPTNRGAMIADGRLMLAQDEVMESTRRNFEGIASVRYSYTQRHITLLSPVSAMITGTGSVTATNRAGETFSRPFAQTIVFLRIDDSWKIAHTHSSTPMDQLNR